jgi:hypothetical protein
MKRRVNQAAVLGSIRARKFKRVQDFTDKALPCMGRSKSAQTLIYLDFSIFIGRNSSIDLQCDIKMFTARKISFLKSPNSQN